MDLDQGGRQLAALILDAAGRGEHDQVADLIGPLDADQLRSLVTVLAVQVDQTMPAAPATGPAAVCELAINAAAPMFGTTPEVLLGADRSRAAADARAVAMTAARIHGHSLPTIARHFDRDHTTVLHATRRIEKTPPLRDLAVKIAAELPDEPPGAGTRQADVEQIPDSGYRSRGARAQERAVPIASERPQLRVAR